MFLDSPGPSILAFVLLLAFSAFFSASETALSCVNKIRLRNKADDGDKRAETALHHAEDYDRTLSSILVGNNVVNLSASSLATVFCSTLLGEQTGPVVATVVVTILVLIFGEIMPKSFAKTNSEKVSLAVARPMTLVKTILKPVVFLFAQLQKLATRGGDDSPSVTEAELKTIIDTVEEDGVLSQQETDMIQNVIEFDDITVQEILVPRVDILAVDVDSPADEIIQKALNSSYTRIPVYEGDIDNIIGMLHTRDLFQCLAQNKPVDVRALCRDIPFVYRTKHINTLLAEFRRKQQHMAIVTDDFGGTLGLVTLEDVLEELVGEIFDETDEAEPPVVQNIGENLYRAAGEAPIDELFEAVNFDDRHYDGDCTTVAGWALECLEHIPVAGEDFDFENLHGTVEEVDDKRILSVLVRVYPPEEKDD